MRLLEDRATRLFVTLAAFFCANAVLAEFIQAAASSRYAHEVESHTQPVRVNGTQTTPNSAQSATQALYWPYWFQIF